MLYVFTGDGKGKTTSAIGCTARALGYSESVVFVEFMKGWDKNHEEKFFEKIDKVYKKKFKFKRFGTDSWIKKGIKDKNFKAEKKEIEKGLKWLKKELKKNRPFLLVLDEVVNAVYFDLISEQALLDILSDLPRKTNVIMTGRNVTEKISEAADLVSEIKEVKHYYKKKSEPVEGIDY